ncbi:DUF2946 family protein [Azospirillum baldaniorum]|uniref:DUF2946 domain-containing protein n=1 Tax=Azospirillum baldaniorum TaxID=1064539 RepID=A0A9P1JN94_9PROT|nr:exported protein of unknown function [Azospirillum baldaniorum]
MRETTAWVAALVLVFHALVMATHVPAPLARVLAESAQFAMAGSICHSGAAPDASAAPHSDHGPVPDGTPGHVTYCPICLSLGSGSLLGPGRGAGPAAAGRDRAGPPFRCPRTTRPEPAAPRAPSPPGRLRWVSDRVPSQTHAFTGAGLRLNGLFSNATASLSVSPSSLTVAPSLTLPRFAGEGTAAASQ